MSSRHSASRLLEGYGLSETSPVASFNHPDRPTRPGTVGIPIRGVEFGLRDSTTMRSPTARSARS